MTTITVYPDYQCDAEDPRSQQPDKIKLPLKPHQLTSIQKMKMMEADSSFIYATPVCRITVEDATVGILADRPGYGKTLTVLGLIAANDEFAYPKSAKICSREMWAGQNFSIKHDLREPDGYADRFIKTTLIVVPHGPVFQQWLAAITQHTTLTVFAIGKTADLAKIPTTSVAAHEYLSAVDIVLVSGTYYPALRDLYHPGLTHWKRLVIDEAHSIVIGRRRMREVITRFAWFVTGTPDNLRCPSSTGYIRYSWPINYDQSHKYLTVRNKEEYVIQSFTLPPSRVRQYICKDMYRLDDVRGFASPALMDMLNANDIASAIGALNGSDGDNIMELIAKDLMTDIANKKIEIESVERQTLQDRDKRVRLERLTSELGNMEERYKNIQDRLQSYENHECSICCCNFTDPVTLSCTHVFCGECIMKWIQLQRARHPLCPECKSPIDLRAIVRLTNTATTPTPSPRTAALTKDEVVLQLILSKPDGKFLVFAKHDGCFHKLKKMLDDHGIMSKQMKGQPSYQNRVLEDYKIGALRVIMLNSRFSGSGIDLHYATDIVLYQKFDEGTTTQVCARADRVGRTSSLQIHKLFHANELPANHDRAEYITAVDSESLFSANAEEITDGVAAVDLRA